MRWLLLVVAAFLALTTLYNFSIPLGEGPDEPGHLRYALFLAREGRLPVQRVHPEVSDVPGEGHQPPLAYLTMVPAVAWLSAETTIAQTMNPQFLWAGGDQPNAFMRGSWELERSNGMALAWHLARGVSAGWALIAVIGTYLAARTLNEEQRTKNKEQRTKNKEQRTKNKEQRTKSQEPRAGNQELGTKSREPRAGNQEPGTTSREPRAGNQEPGTKNQEPGTKNQEPGTKNQEPGTKDDADALLSTQSAVFSTGTPRRSDAFVPVLAAALAAFNPQFLFSSALVTNDTALAAFGAILLWLCLRAVARRGFGLQLRAFVLMGSIFGLALITKQSALLLGPLLLWAGWRAANGNWRHVSMHTLAWGLPALAVSSWWFVRNWRVYGDLFGLEVFTAEFAGQPFAWSSFAAWRDALIQLFSSFWGRFGWMSLPAPGWMIGLYALLCGGALLGLLGRVASAARRRATDGAPDRRHLVEGLLVLSGMAVAWTLAFAWTAGLVAWQGRMLFPAISALAILTALGALAGLRRVASARWAAASVITLLLGLAVYAPLGVIRPAYPWVALAPAQAQASLGTPFYARFAEPWEQGVVLRGWRIAGPAVAGSDLPIALTWNSLAHIPKNWAVFLHLVDADGNLMAVRDSDPVNGALPLTLWTPGDWIADAHTLALPPDLPPGRYELRVGLFRAETDGRRSAVWAENGALIGDSVTLGEVEVRGE